MAHISYPITLHHDGDTYSRTEKYGRRISSGEHAAEYESINRDGFRVWMTQSGIVYED